MGIPDSVSARRPYRRAKSSSLSGCRSIEGRILRPVRCGLVGPQSNRAAARRFGDA